MSGTEMTLADLSGLFAVFFFLYEFLVGNCWVGSNEVIKLN